MGNLSPSESVTAYISNKRIVDSFYVISVAMNLLEHVLVILDLLYFDMILLRLLIECVQ